MYAYARAHVGSASKATHCGRCHCSNPNGVGICQNPQCGGEPVSRSVDAITQPSTQSPVVFAPRRQCFTTHGIPKLAYNSFDEAHDVVLATAATQKRRVHAYRCDEHGWHVGSNRDVAA